MELGKVKDLRDKLLDKMDEVDPLSDEYEKLDKRVKSLESTIEKEERRIAEKEAKEEALEIKRCKVHNDAVSKELAHEESIKNRVVQYVSIGAMAILGVGSIFADETRVVCRAGFDMANNLKRLIH